MRQIQVADLTASANEIDNRMGPIPGRSSDRIANELRWAAAEIERLLNESAAQPQTAPVETPPDWKQDQAETSRLPRKPLERPSAGNEDMIDPIEDAHAALDKLGIPRSEDGVPWTAAARIEQIRAPPQRSAESEPAAWQYFGGGEWHTFAKPTKEVLEFWTKPELEGGMGSKVRPLFTREPQPSAGTEQPAAPFLTGDALRASLRGSDCLAAEADVNGRTEEQELDRLVEIAEHARRHWLAAQATNEPQTLSELGELSPDEIAVVKDFRVSYERMRAYTLSPPESKR